MARVILKEELCGSQMCCSGSHHNQGCISGTIDVLKHSTIIVSILFLNFNYCSPNFRGLKAGKLATIP